jgi:hypothetical protein
LPEEDDILAKAPHFTREQIKVNLTIRKRIRVREAKQMAVPIALMALAAASHPPSPQNKPFHPCHLFSLSYPNSFSYGTDQGEFDHKKKN